MVLQAPLAKQLYKKAAEQGNSIAQYNLGELYNTGQGGQKDYALAKQIHISPIQNGIHTPKSPHHQSASLGHQY